MSVPYERIVKEDLNLGIGQTLVSMPGGGTAMGTQINLAAIHTGASGDADVPLLPLGSSVDDVIAALQTLGLVRQE